MLHFTQKELNAIALVSKKNKLTLRLSQRPWVYFTTADHQKIAMRIADIVSEYESDRKQEARNKAWVGPKIGPIR